MSGLRRFPGSRLTDDEARPLPLAPYYPRITWITQGYGDDAMTRDERPDHLPL